MSSLSEFQWQFGRNICYGLAILLILGGVVYLPIGCIAIILGGVMVYFINKFDKKKR